MFSEKGCLKSRNALRREIVLKLMNMGGEDIDFRDEFNMISMVLKLIVFQ